MRLCVFATAGFIWLSLTGCAPSMGPRPDTSPKAAPRELDEVTVAERARLLQRAQVWRAIDTGGLDLLRGPAGRHSFTFDQPVTCAFVYPKEPLTGVTPKFRCLVAPGDDVKVKYGEKNGEVHAEVAATRLFWALGFIVDRMYPVKVTCTDCPADPFAVSSREWSLGKPANGRTRVFDPATIERPVEGEDIEVPNYEGWSWKELDALELPRERRAHVDALKLLAAFVQHVDSKPAQQAIICPDSRIREDRAGNETCQTPLLVVKDLGATFGGAKKLNYDKMRLASWRNVPIWKDAARCQADLTRSIIGTLEHPIISEAGRAFLAERLNLLSDAQLRALFTAARVDRLDEKRNGRRVTVEDWVVAFKEKRAAIANHRCPSASGL